jgi:hypothetical protein
MMSATPSLTEGEIKRGDHLFPHYRDILRGAEDNPHVRCGDTAQGGSDPDQDKTLASPSKLTFFVFIDGSKETLMARIAARTGHFMKEKMLDSQLATLERPGKESDVVVVDVEAETQVNQAAAGLKRYGFELDDKT